MPPTPDFSQPEISAIQKLISLHLKGGKTPWIKYVTVELLSLMGINPPTFALDMAHFPLSSFYRFSSTLTVCIYIINYDYPSSSASEKAGLRGIGCGKLRP